MTKAQEVPGSLLLHVQRSGPNLQRLFVPVTQVSASPSPNTFVPKYLNMNLGQELNTNNLLPSSRVVTANFDKLHPFGLG